MKIFITGATGFIGKHLVRRLVSEGHSVRCLVRKTSQTAELIELGVDLIYGDVNDCEVLKRGMAGCDWLFHLANLYSMWEPDSSRFTRVNIEGTRNVLSAALQCEVQKVVYVSTVAVYGKPDVVPFDESAQPGPVFFSEYARTKAAANEMAWEFYHKQGLPLVVLYPGIVLGAGDGKASGRYIQDIIRRRVPSTIFHHSFANYVHVEDVVEAMLRSAERPEAVGQKYLIGKTVMDGCEYARMISEISGVPLPLFRFPDWMVIAAAHLLTWVAGFTHRSPWWGLSVDASRTLKNGFIFDGSKAERELGIRYTSIQQALCEAVASYREQWEKRAK